MAETCSQVGQSPPTKASNIHPTGSGWHNQYTSDNTPSFAWTAATDPDGDLAGYYIAIDDPTPDGGYGNDWTIGTVTNWTVPSSSPVSDGSHFVAITSRDSAGHVNPPNTNVKGDAPYYDFVVDTRPPAAPTISVSGSGCGGVQNNLWQKTCYDPAFTWGASDSGSGIKDYHHYWGTSPNGSPDTWTTETSFDPGAIAPADGYAKYYLNVTARDNLDHESGWSSFGVLYDGTIPTVTLSISNGAETVNQTNVLLNLSANDTGSGVADVRISDNNLTWSDWQPYAADPSTGSGQVPWTTPALDRRTHTVYVQVRDRAGNESAVASDSIYLDLYPPMPHSTNYRICADVIDVGGSVGITSTSYSLVSAIGQPWATGAVANASSEFSERAGFLSSITGCLPITYSVTSFYTVTNWVVASGGNLRGSASYRLGDTAGQPAASGGAAFTSTNYVLSSGFWAQITGTVPPTSTLPPPTPTVTPTVTPTPTPTPTPQPGGFGASINDGALYTNDPGVTVRLWAPNVTQMRLSNDGGYSEEGWRTYQVTTTWVISTYGGTSCHATSMSGSATSGMAFTAPTLTTLCTTRSRRRGK